jgi:hypothetical protein
MSKQVVATSRIEQFCNLINKGIEAWVEAGKVLIKIVEEDSAAFDKISAAHPHLTFDILSSFERIGRGEIYPYLLVDGSPGARKLAALPYNEQVEVYNGDVAVVTKGVGGFKIERIKIHDMTAVQAVRVFDINRIRTPEEQKALFQKKISRNATRYLSGPKDSGYGEREQDPAPEPEESPHCDLEDDPRLELSKLLTQAHAALLEARTALSILKRGSQLDIFITRALTEVGHIRLAVNEGEF